jgi:GNAT superfamily N-acetyltransferase
MTLDVRAWVDPDEAGLAPLLRDEARLPFVRGYGLPAGGVRRYLARALAEAAVPGDASRLLVAESGGSPAAALVVQRAPWESGIYGISMARIPWALVTGAESEFYAQASALLDAARALFAEWGVEHVSALVPSADTGVVHAFERAGWRLVDSTLEFAWRAGATTPGAASPRVAVRPARESDRAPLTALTREVYTRSIRTRFLADPWLAPAKTGELYARWFENALDGTFGDHVGVAEMDGRPVGFNTLKLERELSQATGVEMAAHGIAAVDPIARGLGAQPALLHDATAWFGARGGRFTRGRVLIHNHAMQRACLKSGGFIAGAFHTFHLWCGRSAS